MEFVISYIFIGVFIIALLFFFRRRKSYNLPPGPFPFPIVGNALQIPNEIPIQDTFTQWAEKYGNIFTIRIGNQIGIVLNDPKLIREALNHPSFNGRPNDKVYLAPADGDFGVIIANGENWAEQRRFTIRHLRSFGFGKNKMENLILDEAKELLESFRSEEGKPFDPSERFSLAVLNSLWFIVTGSRFSQNDDRALSVLSTFFKQLTESFVTTHLSSFPVLADIAPEWSGYTKLKKVMKETQDFFMEIVREHESGRKDDENEEPRDYIDAYLKEMKNSENNPNSSFHPSQGYKNLLAIIGDFFAAGAETMSATLTWSVLYLGFWEEWQVKFQEEIDRVIGQYRLPSITDRPNMPYTEALMAEILRKSSIASVGLFHRATEDGTLGGYDIPANSFIITHFYRVHHNPIYWDNPSEFNPNRFLTKDSSLDNNTSYTGGTGLRFLKSEYLMPFSVGKRACLGESVAKDELFLFLTTIYQKLTISLDPASSKPSLQPQNTFIDRPFPFNVIAKDRNI